MIGDKIIDCVYPAFASTVDPNEDQYVSVLTAYKK